MKENKKQAFTIIPKYDNPEIEEMFIGKNLVMTKNKDLRLNYNLWKQKDMWEICPYFDESNIQNELYLNNNFEPKIICQIKQIKFGKLKCLDLWDNMIQSVQILSRMYVPELETIYLYNNRITNIKTMRKIHFPSLSKLSIQNNPISNSQELNKLDCQKLLQIGIQSDFNDCLIGDDYRWIIKMKGTFTNLFIMNEKRIERVGCNKQLKSKHQNLTIWFK